MIADWAATAMFVVFAVALLAKVRSVSALDDFAASLSQFGIRSIGGQRLLAAAVLLLEALACGGLVLLVHHPLARFILPVVLLLGFSVGVALSGRAGRLAACHCFGTSTELPTPAHLALNCLPAALGCLAMVTDGPAGTAGDTALGVGLGVITGVLFAGSADLYLALSTGGPANRSAVSERVG
ncbi:MAG: MauE/DoxX family redox-associated membrane protein [Jatrophihabitans sp.]